MKSLEGTVYEPTGEILVRNPKNHRVSLKRICDVCKKEIYVDLCNIRKGYGRYCSMQCSHIDRGNKPPKKRVCQYCNKEFYEFESRIKDGKGKFCSKECYSKSMEVDKVDLQCDYCGIKMNVHPYRSKRKDSGEGIYCSKECFKESRKTGDFCKCENPNCNNIFYRQKNHINKNKMRFCSRDCAFEILCGKNHHLWKDDKIGREEHEFTSKQKRIIFERYGYKCAVTGLDITECKLHVHHIDPIRNGGSNDIYNGIPLWEEIHKKVHCENFDIVDYIIK